MKSIIQIQLGKKMYEGNVTYEEGDIVDADFSESVAVSVGDPVRCMITRNYEELYTFEGVVLAKEAKRLILFNPLSVVEYREGRRRYPRFDVSVPGWIRLPHMQQEKGYTLDPEVEVVNISLGGVAFRFDRPLPEKTPLTFYTELYGRNREDEAIRSHLEVVHVKQDNGYLHGCKITGISGKDLHTLRKYLLKRQLELRKGK